MFLHVEIGQAQVPRRTRRLIHRPRERETLQTNSLLSPFSLTTPDQIESRRRTNTQTSLSAKTDDYIT